MIRVNLARDRTQVKESGGRSRFSGVNFSFGRSGGKSSLTQGADIIIKFVVLLVPVGALMFFEQTNITAKESQLSQIQSSLQKQKAEFEKLKLEVEAVENFKSEKKKLQTRLDTVKLLSKERLRVVKSLETIQNAMPEKAWLTKIIIQGEKIDVQGSAVEELEISNLMQSLEDSVFFKTVMLQSASQVKSNDGIVKSFKISAQVESN